MAAAAKDADAARAARLRRGRARTLQTAGKVMRYRGALPEAEARLREALALYQHGGADASSAADGGGSEDEWGAAATLHELGVVSIRRSEWAPAAELLQRSLEMKRRLKRAAAGGGGGGGGVARVHSSGASQVRFSEEAATLHQLAVVATNARPARLEQAEALLRDALALESAGPFALGGRAATLQQLARVSERRGDRAAAEAHLGKALALYTRAYGDGVPHVNVAAVLSQLGNLALAPPADVDAAERYLRDALSMRLQIYGRGAHVEIAANVGKCAEVERARGALPRRRSSLNSSEGCSSALHSPRWARRRRRPTPTTAAPRRR